MSQTKNPKLEKSLENIVQLAGALHYSKKNIKDIKKIYAAGAYTFGGRYIKTLENAASEIITQNPFLLEDYFEYLNASANRYTGSGVSRDWDEEFDEAFNSREYIKVVKELVLQTPWLADIIAIPLLAERTFYGSAELMDDDGESAVKNAVTRVKNKEYGCIKNLGLNKKKLQVLEREALRLKKAKLMDGIPEEYWETAPLIIQSRPEMFREFINFGIKIEKREYLTSAWKIENYMKNAPEILITRPNDFHKFKRAAELIVKNSRGSGDFFKYGPEIFCKHPKSFLKYCRYGIKASSTYSAPRFGEKIIGLEQTHYFRIAHKLITMDEKLFDQYIDNIAMLSNNFTENKNIKDYMWQATRQFKSPKREQNNKEKIVQILKKDRELGRDYWIAKIERSEKLRNGKYRNSAYRRYESVCRPQVFEEKELKHNDDSSYNNTRRIPHILLNANSLTTNSDKTDEPYQQGKEKPLEEVIIRSMNVLRKKKVDISEEIYTEIQSLSKSHPDSVREYFRHGIELASRYKQTNLSQDYINSAIDIIKQRPESLSIFYEYGRRITENIALNQSNDRFSSMAKVLINAPQSFAEYMDLGVELVKYDSTFGEVADTFISKFAKVAIDRPINLKKVSGYLKEIYSVDNNRDTLISALNIADLLIYSNASKRIQTYKSIVKIRKKIGVKNIALEKAYLNGAKKILENTPENIALFEKEGLRLLKNKYNIAAITQAFFQYSPNVLIITPELLREYIDTGVKYIRKILDWEKYGKNTKEYFSISDALVSNPISFKKKIAKYEKIDANKFTSRKIMKEWSEDCRNSRYFDVRTVIPDKSIWLQNPWSYRVLSKFATQLYSKDWYLGKLVTHTNNLSLIEDKKRFLEYAETGLRIAEASVDASRRYFGQFNNHTNQQSQENSIQNIARTKDILSANQEHILKQKEYQIDYWDINPYRRRKRGYGDHWGIITKQTYDITSAIIKNIGNMKLTRLEENALNKLPEYFLEDIRKDHKQIRDQNRYPIINEILKGEKILPDRDSMHLSHSQQQYGGINSDNDARIVMRTYIDELVHYFKKTLKVNEDSLKVWDQLYDRTFSDFDSNTIITEIHKNKVEDYFSDRVDCISYLGKYAEESKNFIINPYSAIININGYICFHGREFQKTLGKVITSIVDLEGKKVLYISGISANKELDYIYGWEQRTYKNIIKIAKQNAKNIDGILWDLNPRNRDYLSHKWAEHVANSLGLMEEQDYNYQKKNFSTEEFKTDYEEKVFELINPEWKQIHIMRTADTKGKFFLEGVMQEPKNKEIGQGIKPDLVYDKGYVIGKYVSISR